MEAKIPDLNAVAHVQKLKAAVRRLKRNALRADRAKRSEVGKQAAADRLGFNGGYWE